MSVTVDTNCYVSALNFGGRERYLIGMANAGALVIDISDDIKEELLPVLRQDLDWDGYRINDLSQRFRKFTNRVTPERAVQVVDDPDDDRIIACALAGGSEYIVTNGKALLREGLSREYRS